MSFSNPEPDSSRLLGSHPDPLHQQWCHIHFFIVLQFPLWFLYPSFAACSVCHVVLWMELSSGRGQTCVDTLRSHDLLPFLQSYCLLTAQNRKLVQQGYWVCMCVCVGANLSPLCWVSIVFLMIFTWRTMFLLRSSSPVNLSSACVQHTSNNCIKIVLHELSSQSVTNLAAHYFDSNFILNRGSNIQDQNPDNSDKLQEEEQDKI